MAQIFVSYSHADLQSLRSLARLLRYRYGKSALSDHTNVDDQAEASLAEIANCRLFIILVSRESLESPRCQRELEEAVRLGKPLLSLIVRQLKPGALDTLLGNTVLALRQSPLDFSDGFEEKASIGSLYEIIDNVARPRHRRQWIPVGIVAAMIGLAVMVIALYPRLQPMPPPRPIPTAVATACKSQIAFTSTAGINNLEIFVMDADSTDVRRLTNNPATDRFPSWSPDGSMIVFSSFRNGKSKTDENIYVMNADGSQVRQLTDSPAVEYNPTWSGDGSRIAYISGGDGQWNLYVMNADGSNQHTLTSQSWNTEPAWSPDGSRIAFGSEGKGVTDIHVINPDGTDVRRLTDSLAYLPIPTPEVPAIPPSSRSSAWSPDGSKIAFTYDYADAGVRRRQIYIMNANGTEPHPVMDNGAGPVWSPDGSQIAFSVYQTDRRSSELYVMNADGSDVRRLTDNRESEGEAAWGPCLHMAQPQADFRDTKTQP